ncbi:hypothetical protein SPONN_2203 [uncultured Candidatus Thioglobus sp.]|nr:hypothetical protein SPONN_2203 [uncultured Candidatus Thioglobus sp.]
MSKIKNDSKQNAKNIFSMRLRNALKDNNLSHLTYKELGRFFDVTDVAAHNWLNGKGMPAMTRLPEIAKKLSVSVEYLMPVKTHQVEEVYLDDEQVLLNNYRQLSKTQKQLLGALVKELV